MKKLDEKGIAFVELREGSSLDKSKPGDSKLTGTD
jgi:hypothetical protein